MKILVFLIIILAYIVCIGILNEKLFHIQSDIATILFSLIISVILLLIKFIYPNGVLGGFVENLGDFGFEEYLMDGMLCFMLFWWC